VAYPEPSTFGKLVVGSLWFDRLETPVDPN